MTAISGRSTRARVWVAAVLVGCATAASGSAHEVTLPGLRDTVEVLTPETAIPTIVARNELDAAFVQGYLHARDRFFQMDFNRRLASGTVSELVGPAGLSNDIELRTLGFRRAAWQTYAASSASTRAQLQAYANGVNAYLASHPLPPEYGALELTMAEPWSPVDSLAFAKLLAFSLSDDLIEIDLTIALATYQGFGSAIGFNGAALFFEDTWRIAPPDDRVSAPGFLASIGGIGQKSKGLAKAVPEIGAKRLAAARALRERIRGNPYLNRLLESGPEDLGSNFWMVSGAVTDTGAPIIANDPHLSLDTPPVWYPIHVSVADDSGPIANYAGVSFAGAPGIAQGCNANLCWGSTVNPIDEMDFFFEEVRVNNLGLPTHTVYQGQEEPIIWIYQSYFANQLDGMMDNIEQVNIGIDGGAITFVVPRRNNGPVLPVGGQFVSVQYTGWGPTFELEAFQDMRNATDVFEFQQAVTKFDFGSQNFGVADTAGNIAYFVGGELPIREDLQTLNAPDGGIPPFIIRDGTGTLRHEWLPVQNPQPNQAVPYEIMPAGETPQVVNPATGYIANGNNDPVGTSLDNNPLNQLRPGGGLYYLSSGYVAYRMGRIDRLLQDAIAAGPVSVAQIKAMQANNQLLDAELVMPHLMTAFENAAQPDAWPGIAQFAADPQIQQVMGLFAGWDFSTPTGVPEGYDPGDNPFALGAPTASEIDNSVAATVFSIWRSQAVKNTIDATLSAIGLGDNLPPSRIAYNSLKHHLDTFDANHGVGASGINFFTNPQAPDPAAARDFVLLASLRQGLDLLASDEFAPAFGNSSDVMDYRWGRLHRIVFDHPLNDIFSLPNGLYGLVTTPGLPGVARGGGYEAVDASSHSSRADGLNEFMFGSGASRRFVGQMFPTGTVAEQIIAGGQSGVIGGIEYANQLYFWLVNGYLPLLLDAAVVDQIALSRQVFQPVP